MSQHGEAGLHGRKEPADGQRARHDAAPPANGASNPQSPWSPWQGPPAPQPPTPAAPPVPAAPQPAPPAPPVPAQPASPAPTEAAPPWAPRPGAPTAPTQPAPFVPPAQPVPFAPSRVEPEATDAATGEPVTPTHALAAPVPSPSPPPAQPVSANPWSGAGVGAAEPWPPSQPSWPRPAIVPSPARGRRRMLVGILIGILIGLVVFGPGGYLLARFTTKPAHPVATASTAASGTARPANVSAPPDGWTTNGSAKIDSGTVVLTTATKEQTGTCVFGTPLITKGLHAAFTIQISGGTGGDGLTFMLLDAGAAKPTALGAGGGGMGFAGLPGVAVAFTTYGQPGDPSSNFIGVSAGGNGRNLKYLATSTNVPNLRSGTHAVQVVVGADGQSLTVLVDQAQVLQVAAQLPANAYVGFSAGTGGQTDIHEVSKTSFSY